MNVARGAVPSLVDLAPAAGWDEREAHDLHGVEFAGHEPLRPLVDHDLDLAHWTVPVRGDDPYQVAVGPIHAGVIESGHFRFRVVGERILHVDARLFYKHRGLERAAEGATLEDGIAFASRACAACAVTNAVAYAHACEDALGLVPDPELARVRTILLELERLWSHLNDIAAVCAGVGLAAGNNAFAALAERGRRLNAALTGHRFLFGSVRVGGSALTLDDAAVRAARMEIDVIRADSERMWRALLFNASFQDRLPEIGIVTAADVERLGAVGPAARAAGVEEDVRATSSGSPTRDSGPWCRVARPETCRPGSSSARSSFCRHMRFSTGCSPSRSSRLQRKPARRSARSEWAGWRARAARPAASSSGAVIASSGFDCGPVRMRTGRQSPSQRSTTYCPTFR